MDSASVNSYKIMRKQTGRNHRQTRCGVIEKIRVKRFKKKRNGEALSGTIACFWILKNQT